jgi:PQQ-like domain
VRFGSLLVLAADTGLVHGLDADGRSQWRLRGPGPLAAPPAAGAASCLILFRTSLGASLCWVDAATGRRRVESSLDLFPTGSPVAFAGRVAVPGTVGGDSLLTALEPTGSLAWTSAPSLGSGPFALAPTRSAILVKTSDGSCASLGRDGRARWTRSREGGASVVGNLAPVVARGLAFVASEEVEVLELERGERLGRLPTQAPTSLLTTEDLSVWTLDGEGLLTAARLRGHLSVLS